MNWRGISSNRVLWLIYTDPKVYLVVSYSISLRYGLQWCKTVAYVRRNSLAMCQLFKPPVFKPD